jgi:hypothetical protein
VQKEAEHKKTLKHKIFIAGKETSERGGRREMQEKGEIN